MIVSVYFKLSSIGIGTKSACMSVSVLPTPFVLIVRFYCVRSHEMGLLRQAVESITSRLSVVQQSVDAQAALNKEVVLPRLSQVETETKMLAQSIEAERRQVVRHRVFFVEFFVCRSNDPICLVVCVLCSVCAECRGTNQTTERVGLWAACGHGQRTSGAHR
jgi:hypothetical protein